MITGHARVIEHAERTDRTTHGRRSLPGTGAQVHELKEDQFNALAAWMPHLQIKEIGEKGHGNDMETQEASEQGSMKLSMAFHPLHECPLSTIAAKQRHQLGHPVATGEVRAAVPRALIVEGALFLEAEAPRIPVERRVQQLLQELQKEP